MVTDKRRSKSRAVAAGRRVDVAIAHIEAALLEVANARADLSTVIGAPSLLHAEQVLSRTQHALRMYAADDDARCDLDHDPTPAEVRRGHGRDHGCGLRKR